jgi:hypothetical protein
MKYRHYKGGLYDWVGDATLESDLTPMTVYRAQDGSLWIRPTTVFFELVDVDGEQVPRFTALPIDSVQ